MDQEPIYRAAHRRTRAQMFVWRRTASLVSAAVALTVSGVALGYQGLGVAPAPAVDVPARQLSLPSVPVPNIILPLANGGHPDLIGALSAQLISSVQVVRTPPVVAPLGVPEGPMPLILSEPPAAPTPEPIVLSVTIADAAPVADEPAEAIDVAQAVAPPPALALRAAMPPIVEAEAAPDDQVEADVPAAVDDAPAPPPPAAPVQAAPLVRAAPTAAPAPARVSTPVPVVKVSPPKIELPPPVVVRKPDPPKVDNNKAPKPDARQDRKDNGGKDGKDVEKSGASGPHH